MWYNIIKLTKKNFLKKKQVYQKSSVFNYRFSQLKLHKNLVL